MNSRASKRLRIAAVRYFIANNPEFKGDPSVALKRIYKVMKQRYKQMPYHRIEQEFPLEGHSAVLSKIHGIRERSRLEKFLDPKASERVNAQNVNQLEGDL